MAKPAALFTSKLQKPTKVKFDPRNQEHLQLAKQFLTNRAWGSSGNPFKVTTPYMDIVSEMQTEIVKRVFNEGIF